MMIIMIMMIVIVIVIMIMIMVIIMMIMMMMMMMIKLAFTDTNEFAGFIFTEFNSFEAIWILFFDELGAVNSTLEHSVAHHISTERYIMPKPCEWSQYVIICVF